MDFETIKKHIKKKDYLFSDHADEERTKDKLTVCYFCGGKLKKENVNITRYWGRDIIALEDVPALVCTQCGEKYFEAKVSSEIDKKIQQALKKKSSLPQINIPVVQF